jgi:hypothetical protein
LLDLIEDEQVILSVANVVHAQIDADLVGGGAYHHVHDRIQDIDASWIRFTFFYGCCHRRKFLSVSIAI